MKATRRAVAPQQQRLASAVISKKLNRLVRHKRWQRIAAYFGNAGEINPMEWLHALHLQGKHCYLPVLHPYRDGHLVFVRWEPGIPMRANRFGIAEPEFNARQICTPSHLDLVIVPLLGFDPTGERLGMGGGYYDRSFAYRRQRKIWRGPTLVGVAYDFQKVDRISPRPWDVRLDLVLTPTHEYPC